MSKYSSLWGYVQKSGSQYGYKVGKISMKEQTVIFIKE